MTCRKTLVACVVVVLSVLLGAPGASARPPTREVVAAPDDIVINGQCAFDVLGHIEGDEILITFVNQAGADIKLIGVFPGNTVTFTNLDTDKSITIGGTGLFKLQLKRDGTGFGMSAGRGPSISHPITGEPGIYYLTGKLSVTFDVNGDVTSARTTGKLVDLCAELAA